MQVTIPNTVTEIGNGAFENPDLTGITIPEGVTMIGGNAFEGSTRLTVITIPKTVTEIADGAFAGCTGLAEVIDKSAVPQVINPGVFDGVDLSAVTLTVPAASVDDYQVAPSGKISEPLKPVMPLPEPAKTLHSN